jgi:glutamine amidotransferase
MGWNTLNIVKPNELLSGIGEDDYFYFVHSYYGDPVDRDVVVAETDYGINFASVVACENVWATQFHPEKSGKPGEIILRNFAEIIRK